MYISTKDWKNYIDKMRALNDKAADAIVNYVQKNGFENTDELIDFANSVVQKYGGGSAALAAAMYDATAEASGQFYDPAEPAPLPEYGEVAKTVHGTLKRSRNVNELGGAVSRLVKRAGADTTLLNAYRDRPKYGKKRNTGAQVAWIPFGDTCPFCLMLASNGWRNQTIGGAEHHAKHIHANCDCNYAVRFDNHSGVEGYDPDKYKEMFDNVEGDTWSQKVNSMRRENYEKNKDRINAQKRAAYAERQDVLYKNAKTTANEKVEDLTKKWISQFNNNTSNVISDVKSVVLNGVKYIVDNVEVVIDHDEKERKTAEILSKATGQKVILCPRVNGNIRNVSTPDYILGEKEIRWDRKGLTGKGKDAVRDIIKRKKRQSDNFVIDISEWKGDRDNALTQVEKVFDHGNTSFVKTIMVTENNKIIKVLRRK